MNLRYVIRYEPVGEAQAGGGQLTREVEVLQQQVQLYTDPDGTTHYEWQDVPTVEGK